ncbi:hypothetical protein T08_6057 [Trichinella sp. T8]|nr:hypothetical protein T08_6057 [Trichinella sp. T8]
MSLNFTLTFMEYKIYISTVITVYFFITVVQLFIMSIHLPVTLLSGSSFKESSLSKKVNLTYIIWLCLASAHQIHGALFPATTDNNSNANNDADKNHTHGDENPNPKSSNNYTTVGRSILSSAEVRQVLDIYTVGYRLPLVNYPLVKFIFGYYLPAIIGVKMQTTLKTTISDVRYNIGVDLEEGGFARVLNRNSLPLPIISQGKQTDAAYLITIL